MQQLKKWWQRKILASAPKSLTPSTEWLALASAISSHEFNKISPCLRTWCTLAERDPDRLMKAANHAGFSPAQANKLKIFFNYYSNDMANAFAQAQELLATHGFDEDLHIISLISLYQHNQFEDSLNYLQKLSDEQMSSIHRADYWQMVSIIRWATNQMSSLEQAADRTIELAPDDDAVLQTALAMYIELGAQEKIERVRAKLDAKPHAQGYGYSLSLLALGELERGWQLIEARYDIDDAHRYINSGLPRHQLWQGDEPLAGLLLLLTAEQGLGDTIQMARYLPLLKTLGAKAIMLEAQPETISLLQYNFPDIPVVERLHGEAPEFNFDRWTGMMSLPFHLKLWGKNTPGRKGYLQTPPDNAAYWKQRVAQLNPRKLPKIGLAWSGQPAHRADRRRSVPFSQVMAQVRPINATFFALQTVVPDVMPVNVINVTEEMITLADTAALIEQMDLIITVDTSIVHIAGSLAKETWLMLPKRYEWRWGLEGEDNDWYDTVKVIRQPETGDWASVLDEVFNKRLKRFIAEGK